MQDYKLVLRTLSGGNTQLDGAGGVVAQNASEFMSYINEMYLANGYEIQSVQLVRVINPVASEAPQYEFAYHLVKELGVPKGK